MAKIIVDTEFWDHPLFDEIQYQFTGDYILRQVLTCVEFGSTSWDDIKDTDDIIQYDLRDIGGEESISIYRFFEDHPTDSDTAILNKTLTKFFVLMPEEELASTEITESEKK